MGEALPVYPARSTRFVPPATRLLLSHPVDGPFTGARRCVFPGSSDLAGERSIACVYERSSLSRVCPATGEQKVPAPPVQLLQHLRSVALYAVTVVRVQYQFLRIARAGVEVLRELVGEHCIGGPVDEQQALLRRELSHGVRAPRLASHRR